MPPIIRCRISTALTGAEAARRRRRQAHQFGDDLCAPSAERPHRADRACSRKSTTATTRRTRPTFCKKIADAGDVNATFEAFNPPEQGFKELKDKLAALRANASAEPPTTAFPTAPSIKPGTKDARVPLLRERLRLAGKAERSSFTTASCSTPIKHVQARADIGPTGLIDNKTLAAINGPQARARTLDRVTANMERWRWLPRDLGRTYVMVNIPDYTLKVVNEHQVMWRTKIVAGKPQTPTPLLAASMDNVLVNPSWYVPQSIIQNELLPLYASDPNIFDRMGLEVRRGPDGNINVVQPPGAANALGRIKFNFPNKFQVYLHDTPEKRLFAADKRAFSHGCMRVEDPTKFGEIMLHLAMHGPTPNSQQIYAQFGQDEHTYKLVDRPTVHLTYQTAFVDDAGKLQLRDDIYGFDARIHAILHSDERRVADIAPPPDPKRDAATAKANQEILQPGRAARGAEPVRVLRKDLPLETAEQNATSDGRPAVPGRFFCRPEFHRQSSLRKPGQDQAAGHFRPFSPGSQKSYGEPRVRGP